MVTTPDRPDRGHTPTPWDVIPGDENHGAYITTQSGVTLCDLYAMSNPASWSVRNGGDSRPVPFIDAEANAAFIVQAVNNFDGLIAALEEIVSLHLGDCPAYMDEVDFARAHCNRLRRIAHAALTKAVGK